MWHRYCWWWKIQIVGGEEQFVCRLVWWNVVLVESENEWEAVILYMKEVSRVLHWWVRLYCKHDNKSGHISCVENVAAD